MSDYEKIKLMAKPLFDAMAPRVSEEEMALMHLAFEYAYKAHDGQLRKSGDPYIIHPIAVARIVGEELQLGAHPVCAAFLHDVVEDTDTTIENIEDTFGKDVAFLVRVVTKKTSGNYVTSKQVDNFRQMLYSINYDIRALLIKLADRLHNMRTLSSMPQAKQMKIAGETDYFYAPLANRLGLYRVKIELENLSFRYRCPREYAALEQRLEEDEIANAPVLGEFMAKIREKLKAEGIDAFVEADFRRPFSVRRKMIKTGADFNHVEGRHFVRVVYDSDNLNGITEKGMAMKIYTLLSDIFKEKTGSFINYIDSPKDNGYQSLHIKFLNSVGQWEEVHISSTRMRRVSRLGCIAGRQDSNITRWIENLKSTLRDMGEHSHEIDFMEGVATSFYNDDITVYTPGGEAKSLPQRATALDFAFEVHGDKAIHAQYARINGKLSSVKTRLQRGDCVEIGFDPSVSPKADWLDSVLTYKAKSLLKSELMKAPEARLIRCTHCHPLPGDEVIGFKQPDGRTMVHRRDCQKVIRMASQDGDSVTDVEGFCAQPGVLYPVSLHIRAVDRIHLLSDLIDCITNRLKLPMSGICTRLEDEIVDCSIDFFIHSADELQTVIQSLNCIDGVDEVWHVEK